MYGLVQHSYAAETVSFKRNIGSARNSSLRGPEARWHPAVCLLTFVALSALSWGAVALVASLILA